MFVAGTHKRIFGPRGTGIVWALPVAFALHAAIGPARVHERVNAMNTRCKQGLAELKHVKLHTSLDPELSAGIN